MVMKERSEEGRKALVYSTTFIRQPRGSTTAPPLKSLYRAGSRRNQVVCSTKELKGINGTAETLTNEVLESFQ